MFWREACSESSRSRRWRNRTISINYPNTTFHPPLFGSRTSTVPSSTAFTAASGSPNEHQQSSVSSDRESAGTHQIGLSDRHHRNTQPGVGFAASVSSRCGVFAAHCAIQQLDYDWNRLVLQTPNLMIKRFGEVTLNAVPFLPNITGGGSRRAHHFGLLAPFFPPLVFCLAWLALFIAGIVERPP